MNLVNIRRMRLVNLVICLTFCLNFAFSNVALAFEKGATVSTQASMLRPKSAMQRVNNIVLDMGIEKLRELALQGSKALEKELSDLALSKDPSLAPLIENNIAVFKKDDKTFVVFLIDDGGRIDLSQKDSVIEHFKSRAELDKFCSDIQLTWIAGNVVPEQLRKIYNETRDYLIERGKAGAIIRKGDIKKAVDEYSAKRPERKLAILSDKEKATSVTELEALFAADDEIMGGLTQESIDMMMPIGLSPDSMVKVGAQDFATTDAFLKGTAVGVVTTKHLQEIGVTDSLAGHSATRQTEIYEKMPNDSFRLVRTQPGYTSGDITAKLKEALANKTKITLCVGETLKIREEDKNAVGFVLSQLAGELGQLKLSGEQVLNLLEAVAYEPLWAINTGVIATPEQAGEMMAAIRKWFADTYGGEVAKKIKIQYGGSVSAKDAASIKTTSEIFALLDCDGALVGGASLKADAFVKIAQLAEAAGKAKGTMMLVSGNWKAEEAGKRDVIAAHLKVLAGAGLKNTAVNYYLPSTLLAGALDLVNKAKSPKLAEVTEDLKKVGMAVVLDDEGKPSFWDNGKIGTPEHVAVTLSAGGFEYKGFEALGALARSIYHPFAMALIRMEMVKKDARARLAYQARRLHDYFEVSAKGARVNRQETKETTDLINEQDSKAFAIWKQREAEKANAKLLEEESKKIIAEATSANIGKFLLGGAVPSKLIVVAEAELQKLVESKLLTGYRIVTKDGKVSILTTRQNSKAIEDDAKIPSAILNVYLSLLNAAKDIKIGDRSIYLEEKNLTGKTYRQQVNALEFGTSAPTLKYLQPEGWAKTYFGKIRNELKVPEGQKPEFFTSDYHIYTIGGLFAKPVSQIPDAVVNSVKAKLDQDIAQGKLLSAVVKDFGGTGIDIQVTHRYGELNAAVQRLILEAMMEGALKAQELGLLRKDINIASMSLEDLGKVLRMRPASHSITERGAEPVVIAKIIGAGVGAANIVLYHEFFMPGSTPLQKLGFVPQVGEKDKNGVRGFRAIVRRTEDVLKGNSDGPVWEFEKSSACTIKGKYYPSKDETLELLAFASQPNDFLITAIYTVEGSAITSTEPITTVVYQPVYEETGNLRTLDPAFICRSQSGADAVGGVASMFYNVNFVPGGPTGENYVATRPTTLEEARKAPKEGTAHVVVYGWQSKGNGIIPTEVDGIMDHVAINPDALKYEQKLADFLAEIMVTHKDEQPYLAPFAAQARVESIREKQGHLFERAPKEADIDPRMDEVEAKVASGVFLAVDDDKADMGGKFGHNFTPEYMLGIDRATVMEAQEKGELSDGNIIGFTDKTRLKRGTTVSIGDDSHILMLGDKSRNSADSHQLSFLAFTRGYLFAVVNGEKPYGLAQDYQGKEAKAAKANPYFYSHLNERFFEILRQVMPTDHLAGVEKMYAGWKEWEKSSATVTLPEPFSGNVSQQGIGSARYLVDLAGGERVFGILAGDKMGPAALNRPIREGVYTALSAGEFKKGLIFEIWDAKAFDEHGNIPLDKLPVAFADVADAITQLKDKTEQEFVKQSYTSEGVLKSDLVQTDKAKLAQLLKKAGYVPTERIFLDAQADKEAIFLYMADSDRFNIKQVWGKKKSGWDINNVQEYLDKPILGSSVTKLGILAGGEYIGKDDPVMVGHIKLLEHIWAFLQRNPLIIQGDMNGSHWLAAIPTAFKNAVANKESHPILVGLRYTLSDDGQTLAKVEDIFGDKSYNRIRQKMFEFNYKFKQAQLGGQFEPYGTNWRTVEASYPLAKLLRALQSPNSPFLVKNKPQAERNSRPIGIFDQITNLFKIATGTLDMPATAKDWTGADESAQRFLKSALAKQSEGLSHRHSEDVFEISKGLEAQVVLVSLRQLSEDPSLALALASSNEQRNQRLGVFGSTANKDIDAYKIIGIADLPAIKTQKDVDTFFAEIAKETNNAAKVSREMFAAIITQEDMLGEKADILKPADLVQQLQRKGFESKSLKGFIGSEAWSIEMKKQEGVSDKAIAMSVDVQGSKVAFAGNGLFAVIEAIAASSRGKEFAPVMQEKFDLLVSTATSMSVKPQELTSDIKDVITGYRETVAKI